LLSGLFLSESDEELLARCFVVVAAIVHPRVGTDLFNGWSVRTVVSKELQDDVLELC
jgi:hypothetical protein